MKITRETERIVTIITIATELMAMMVFLRAT